jgi:alkanesulfonate monooxygenase SsuD/methylene tetrahydromethanopterin reductase-like flavin-dependent oxidoreductase (luciferase family)
MAPDGSNSPAHTRSTSGGRGMASQARNPQFGVSVVPLAESPEFALRATRAAEEARLDLVGIQDHPYQWRFLDAWILMATLRSPLQ